MFNLSGKVAVVTGGGRGIGGATAARMAEAGAKVMIGDIIEEQGRATAKAISQKGGSCEFVHLDVTSPESWEAAVTATLSAFGTLSVLVNNAGIFVGRDIEGSSLEDCERLCAVNLTGVYLGTKICLPELRASAKNLPEGSVIVNTASIAGLVGSQLDPLYSMTKGGVTTFTKSAALEFSRKNYRIRVNSIHPGVIDTDMGQQTFVSRASKMGTNDVDQAREMALSTHPIGRLGLADDIAKGIVFLASDDSDFMTGAGLVIDGGVTAQ